MTIRRILDAIERIAPKGMALPGDRIGLQVGSSHAKVSRAVVTFDASLAALKFASESGAQLVVSHHPLIWDPLKSMAGEDYTVRRVEFAVRHELAFIACHTNWDACPGGLNDWLAARLGLRNVIEAGTRTKPSLYRLVTMVPRENAQVLLDALAAAGAGSYLAYERCAFLSEGTGTFRPLEGANPTIGAIGKTEEVPETRLEMVVRVEDVGRVTAALMEAHPYEVPDFAMMPMEPTRGQAIARVGDLPAPLPYREFVAMVDERLQTRSMAWGDPAMAVHRVGVCGGAADDEWSACAEQGAQVLVTGEVKQHNALRASESGFGLVAAGHYATEHPSMESLWDRLATEIPEVEWELYTPEPGSAGRPC